MKFVMPAILIGIAIAVFFIFVSPLYGELSDLRGEAASYNEALGNSKALENERDKLTAKYNAFSREDLQKLEKLLPESVDNIRLILEIEQLAAPYGMALKNVQYSAADTNTAVASTTTVARGGSRQARKDYGVLELEFTVSGDYNDFMKFVRDLENNLRIVDIASVEFSSNTSTIAGRTPAPEIYDYNIQIKTYWLKN